MLVNERVRKVPIVFFQQQGAPALRADGKALTDDYVPFRANPTGETSAITSSCRHCSAARPAAFGHELRRLCPLCFPCRHPTHPLCRVPAGRSAVDPPDDPGFARVSRGCLFVGLQPRCGLECSDRSAHVFLAGAVSPVSDAAVNDTCRRVMSIRGMFDVRGVPALRRCRVAPVLHRLLAHRVRVHIPGRRGRAEGNLGIHGQGAARGLSPRWEGWPPAVCALCLQRGCDALSVRARAGRSEGARRAARRRHGGVLPQRAEPLALLRRVPARNAVDGALQGLIAPALRTERYLPACAACVLNIISSVRCVRRSARVFGRGRSWPISS